MIQTIQRPVVRIFQDIVQAVSDDILEDLQAAELAIRKLTQPTATVSNIVGINYQFGHLKELIATMKEYEADPASRSKKYPFIALMLDFNEDRGLKSGYYADISPSIIIAYAADPLLKAKDRYSVSFEPILLPIYESLMRQIAASSAFVAMDENSIPHRKTDRPFWGKGGFSDGTGNVFVEPVDAIELSNLRLTKNFNNC